jgi:hypothetical protein
LLHILILFEDSRRISDKFEWKAENNEAAVSQNLSAVSATELAILSVDSKMKALAAKRRSGAGILKLTSWAIYHSKTLSRLMEDISELVSSLEQLFPPPPTAQARLTAREVSEVQGEQEMRVLVSTAEGVDPALYAAANQFTGHQYKNSQIDAGEGGAVINGNAFSNDYSGAGDGGSSHLYDGISIKGANGLKVLNGNRYGGEDFFSQE